MDAASAAGQAGGEEAAASDSSSALSTPPPHALSRGSPAHPQSHNSSGVDVVPAASSTLAKNNSATTSTNTANASNAPPAKKTRQRKPKDPNAPPEEKKTRAPRKPKDPNAPPKPRKRLKTEHDEVKVAPAASHQQKITDLVGPAHAPAHPNANVNVNQTPTHSQTHSPSTSYAHPPPHHQHQHPHQHQHHVLPSNVAPPTPRPASSGQLFDPIRASQSTNSSAMPPVSPQPRMMNRASASPSITSLIDPPQAPQPGQAGPMQHQSRLAPAPATGVTSNPVSPMPMHRPNQYPPPPQPLPTQRPPVGSVAQPMEIDSDKDAAHRQQPIVPKKMETGSAGPSSNAPTPPNKASRQTQAPPPLPTGSGLLSGTPFGGISTATNGNGEKPGTNIWLTFDLKGKNNVTINFAREVEKTYGFAALHPRIAARNEKRRQMAAAAAALEKNAGVGSADDMSVDLSDPEKDSDMGEEKDDVSLTAAGLPRQRKRKVEDYDRTDEFIDDTEMAWEQQALMAKDGFFVYSGPLVTEGEKQVVERADGTVRRGRGRGRGGATRGETSGRGSRGGAGTGRGSRGGTTVRKPRVTKADRAMMEQEKLERERLATSLAAKPGPGVVQFAGSA
ncbi:HPC2-domain-containing protein [Rhizodiscina lignyota]|uniref:HPC2-domain-containing protein n=1 Tax=Rhizodiscina lignyota TaxID=1504668 RepID=A0A9P4ICI7_9PEZI|nr:HPC2-domain-containing protein [Rhizodiscina lignyota]